MSIRWVSAIVAVLLLGCSGSTTAPIEVKEDLTAGAGRDSCDLLTLEDVQQMYGSAMKKSQTNRSLSGLSNDVSICSYVGGDPFVVATMIATWGKMENPVASRDSYAEATERDLPANVKEGMKIEKVEFEGLPALWQSGRLKVFNKDVMLSILADAAPGKDAKRTTEALMLKAIGRL